MTKLSATVCMLAVLLPQLCGRRAAAVDTTWTFNGSGNWTAAGRWDNGQPVDETFNVFIDDGDSAVTVTLNVVRTVGSVSIGSNDTLRLQSLGTFDDPYASLTATNGINNLGTIVLTNTSLGGGMYLTVSSGALVNAPGAQFTITGFLTVFGFYFDGELINHGSVLVDHQITFRKAGATYSNYGDLTVANRLSIQNGGVFDHYGGIMDLHEVSFYPSLVLSGSTLNLRGGELHVGGSIDLPAGTLNQFDGALHYTAGVISDGSFNYFGGTITGTPQLKNTTLQIGPAATDVASFLLNDNSSFLGDVHAGQQLTARNTTPGGSTLTSSAGFVNKGSIFLTSAASGPMGLAITSGTFNNAANVPPGWNSSRPVVRRIRHPAVVQLGHLAAIRIARTLHDGYTAVMAQATGFGLRRVRTQSPIRRDGSRWLRWTRGRRMVSLAASTA